MKAVFTLENDFYQTSFLDYELNLKQNKQTPPNKDCIKPHRSATLFLKIKLTYIILIKASLCFQVFLIKSTKLANIGESVCK